MNEEKSLMEMSELSPQVRRKQKAAWWLMLVGMILSTLTMHPIFESLFAIFAFMQLGSVASNSLVRLVCKRMVWVQTILAVLLLTMFLMNIDLGGDIIEMDAVVILGWCASVWCYGALAKSGTLGDESIGWLNVVVTFIIARAFCVAMGDDDFVEVYSALSFGWVFVMASVWRKLVRSEAFVGRDMVPTAVEPRKAFGLVSKYTILAFLPLVVVLLWLFA